MAPLGGEYRWCLTVVSPEESRFGRAKKEALDDVVNSGADCRGAMASIDNVLAAP